MTSITLDMNPTSPRRLARRRPAGLALSPLGAAGFPPFGGVGLASTEFGPTGFADTQFAPADPDDTGFAPTQWLERRRVPRAPLAGLGEVAPSLPPARVARARVVAPPVEAMTAAGAMAMSEGLDDEPRGGAFRAFGRLLERTLDRLLPSALGTFLQLFVCISLSMAALSAMGPMIDRL